MPDFASWSVVNAGSVAGVDAAAFDALDDSCGSAGSHARLLQLEQDRCWATSYVMISEAGRLIAAISAYRAGRHPGPTRHTARRRTAWPFPRRRMADCWSAGEAICVRVCTCQRRHAAAWPWPRSATSWPASAASSSAISFSLHPRGPVCADRRRVSAGAVVSGGQGLTLDALLGPSQLPSRERGVLARDQKPAARHGVAASAHRWQDLDHDEQSAVCTLIAKHAKFSADHAEFARMRMAHWARLPLSR